MGWVIDALKDLARTLQLCYPASKYPGPPAIALHA